MSSSQARAPKLHRPFVLFDPEAAAVASILIGLFQVLLALPLYYMDISLPKRLYVIPVCIGILVVAAGSFAMACAKSPSRQLLTGCAYSNVAGLLGALVALCIYGVALNSIQTFEPCDLSRNSYYDTVQTKCPGDYLSGFFWSVTMLLLVYDIGAIVLHSLFSFSALKGLKAD